MRIVITGGRGFLGRNLVARLLEREDCDITIIGRNNSTNELRTALLGADVVFHLAGVNRPQSPQEFDLGNAGMTELICQILSKNGRSPKIIFSSSVQAGQDNPYGMSKAKAEKILRKFSTVTGTPVRIYRLMHLYGKWCRPNYNSVTATFCYNVANSLPISLSNPTHEIELTYVDDVVSAFISEIDEDSSVSHSVPNIPSYKIRLGILADTIQSFHEMRTTLILPDLAERFHRSLYATYLSYVPKSERQENLVFKQDDRGSLAEFIKQEHLGQIFISRTVPGITRGNHYHHTKTEKFLVVEGKGLIRMRSIEGGPIQEYIVTGSAYQVVNIPPGLTHSITNLGTGEMVTLFWASEIFDLNNPDTHMLPVDFDEEKRRKTLEDV